MPVVDTGHDIFPAVERVNYRKAPLLEVICQVRFPADLRIETEPPIAFQQEIRDDFPLLSRKTQSVLSGMPPEIAKALEAVVPPTGTSTTWQFSTEDGKQSLHLTNENLTLTSTAYDGWDQFFGMYEGPCNALLEIYKPKFFTRIGLRYRDFIHRLDLEIEDTSWKELLAPQVLGELALLSEDSLAIEAQRNLLIALPEKEAKVRLQHGFAEREGVQGRGYAIDCDFFVSRTDITNGHETLHYLHEHAFRYFRGCITDRLHEAMQPEPIG